MPKPGKRDRAKTPDLTANDDTTPEEGDAMLASEATLEHERNVTSADIMKAITSLKQDFHQKIDGVLTAIEANMRECTGRLNEAEERISSAEDTIHNLQANIKHLEAKVKLLASKTDDLECRSRRNNLRITGIAEKEEGTNSCAFIEKWFSETLNIPPPAVERAHRIDGQKRNTNAPLTFIVKFLDYRDKERVLRASRAKGQIMYKDNNIRFHQDLSAEVYKQQRGYDSVRQKLREKGITKHRILFPAKLLVTHRETTMTFDSPAAVNSYIADMKDKTPEK